MAILQSRSVPDKVSSKGGGKDGINRLLGSLLTAVSVTKRDEYQVVRIALARTFSRVMSLLSADVARGDNSFYELLPSMEGSLNDIVMCLLADEDSSVSMVMFSEIIYSMNNDLCEGRGGGGQAPSSYHSYSWTGSIFSIKNFAKLLPGIKVLTMSKNWRARKEICSVLPKMVSISNSVETRLAISAVMLPLLSDDVFDVRKCAATSICFAANSEQQQQQHLGSSGQQQFTSEGDPVQDMGCMWLDSVVLPQLESLRMSKVFSCRVLAVHMIVILIIEKIVDVSDVRCDILLKIVSTLARDSVVNVRIALAKALSELLLKINISPLTESSVSVREALLVLCADTDADVKYFAALAYERYSEQQAAN